jgi:hypothetical protein
MNRSLMQIASLVLSGAMGMTGTSLPAAQESPEDQPVVTVHVYNYARIPAWRLARAKKRVAGFFLGAGIRLQWENTPLPSIKEPSSAIPAWSSGPFDLVLKIISGFPDSTAQFRGPVLGFAEASQATIFNERIEDIASRNVEVTRPEILAIAMAHELGHTLLGPDSHSDTGIMRPLLQPADLKKAQCKTPSFTPEQAERMRRRVNQLVAHR